MQDIFTEGYKHGLFITDIEYETLENENYREVIFTSHNMQLVLMSLIPGEDIVKENHHKNDQFIRVEEGEGMLLIGEKGKEKYFLEPGVAFIIPKGTWHQIINTSDVLDLKLYTIYSPPHHPDNTIQYVKP